MPDLQLWNCLSCFKGINCGDPNLILGSNQRYIIDGSDYTRYPSNLTIVCIEGWKLFDMSDIKKIYYTQSGGWTKITDNCGMNFSRKKSLIVLFTKKIPHCLEP